MGAQTPYPFLGRRRSNPSHPVDRFRIDSRSHGEMRRHSRAFEMSGPPAETLGHVARSRYPLRMRMSAYHRKGETHTYYVFSGKDHAVIGSKDEFFCTVADSVVSPQFLFVLAACSHTPGLSLLIPII